ncbi:Hypothetical protein MVR_LOCUS76 [uncultured virus]|nr:Hypothetical protein MVR_LOCUS76 [uncultured virus]
MGVRADGKLSNLCKVHFADQQNAQATRNMDAKREQGRKYEQGSHRKTIKAEWRDENPDKNKEYVAKSTQKKKHPVALVLSESDTESSESSEEILVARKKAPKKKA